MAEKNIETLEQGDIYFFYRPRVEEEDPDSLSDIERMYMVMHPADREMYRLAIVGHKKMPDPSKHGKRRFWGFIRSADRGDEQLREELGGDTYRTATRGERHRPAARPIGEGVYRVLRHEDHTHLVYALEFPKHPGDQDVQQTFQLEEDASYILSIKNPEKGSPKAAGLLEDDKAEYPKSLQGKFEGRRFFDADPPKFLDYEGTEFVLISASEDVREELGIELSPEKESRSGADIFEDLHLDRKTHPVKPLFRGDWA